MASKNRLRKAYLIHFACKNISDVLDEIAADNQLAESKGVELDADRSSEMDVG